MEMLNNKRIREPKEQTLEYYKLKNDRESENYVCWGKKSEYFLQIYSEIFFFRYHEEGGWRRFVFWDFYYAIWLVSAKLFYDFFEIILEM